MHAGLTSSIAIAGEVFEHDFMGAGEVTVQRVGNSRVQHVFLVNGQIIAKLRWRGLRRAVYEIDGARWDINVGALEKRIAIVSDDGLESFLIERSRANPNKARLRVEMAEGDNFCLMRSWNGRLRSEASLAVQKEFYSSTLLVFHFNMRQRTQTTARIVVKPVMKWEARFIHRLLALISCRIILERRRSGSRPKRVKEAIGPRVGAGLRARGTRRM